MKRNKKKRKQKRHYYSLIFFLTLITVLLFGGITLSASFSSSDTVSIADLTSETLSFSISDIITDTNRNEQDILPPEEPAPPAFEEYDIKLMAVGDNLLHMGIVNTGRQSDGTRNYDFLFEGIRAFLETADIKIINQETIFGGNQLGFQGYPKFNSPTEVGDAIINAGFNVVLQATNHTADQGLNGMQNCIEFWKTHPEILVSGLHDPYTEGSGESHIPLLEIGDFTFAILNYTYGPNSEVVSSAIASQMDMLCAVNESNRRIDFTTLNPKVISDITEAKTLADIVIVCPHWGTEYATVPSSYQEKFAMQMTEAGADVIIGTHPHVVQPVKWIEAGNGNRALCYYSLGNYVSTQKNGESMLEGLAWVTFHVTEEGISISEEKTGIIPMVCQYSSGPLRLKNVYLLEDYTEELASTHGIIPYGGISFHLSSLQTWSNEILGNWVLSAAEVLYTAETSPDITSIDTTQDTTMLNNATMPIITTE